MTIGKHTDGKTAGASIAPAASAVELVGINKHFGAVHANRDIRLSISKGSIHGIVGENGAGKSTLMSILYGYYQADSGEIRIDGKKIDIHNSQDAIRHGIGMVHQHFMLVDNFTVLENIVLGSEGGPMLREGIKQARKTLKHLADQYSLAVDPDKPIQDLSVGLQQRVEILKALYRGADILILDEPTGVLTPQEADHLFEILATLKREGKTVILITHKLREIMAITDRVTVMRLGAVVGTVDTAATNKEALAEMMVGRKLEMAQRQGPAAAGEEILRIADLTVLDNRGTPRVKSVNFSVRRGEILGIAGVAGNGQSELLEALAGMVQPLQGSILYKGQELMAQDPRLAAHDRRHLGIAHVPEDRNRMGLIGRFPAWESFILGYQDDKDYGKGLIDRPKVAELCEQNMRNYDVRPVAPFLRTAAFSGGNQQKIVLAREIGRAPDLLLVGQPTRGVDIGAIEFIHRQLLSLRDRGCAIVLVSVELDEILALSDRIIVMFDGHVMGETLREHATVSQLGLWMAGVTGEGSDALPTPAAARS